MIKVKKTSRTRPILVLIGAAVVAAIIGSNMLFTEPPSQVRNDTIPGPIKHVIVIVLENAAYSSVYENSSVPYLNSIGNKYALLTNYHGISHPSLPNYLAIITGTNFGISDDNSPLMHAFISNSKEVTALMEPKGITWKAYMEAMPSVCDIGSTGRYAVKHNPFVYFSDVTDNSSYCNSHVVSFVHLDSDLTKNDLPNFAFIVPDLDNDGHDTSVSFADIWLSGFLPKIINSSMFSNSVIFVTFDEDSPATVNNHIYTAVVGPSTIVKAGYRSSMNYDHYSLLATIENIYGLGNLGRNDSSAVVINDVFHS